MTSMQSRIKSEKFHQECIVKRIGKALIDFIIVFILHISADHRSLPTAHHEEVCEGLSSHRVRIHTVLFFLIQALIRQHSTFGAYLVHFAFTF